MRTFDGDDIPWKSRFGNTITMSVFSYIAGTKVHDTQTGLRGIPLGLMKEMLGVSYDRFEFEMQMLLDASANYPILELPIETIYDSKENHQTHFRIRRKFMPSWERDFSNIPWHRFLRASLICCCLRFCVISCVTV